MNFYRFFYPLLFFIFSFHSATAQEILISSNSFDDFSLGYTKVIGQDESGYFVLTSNRSIDQLSERSGHRNRKYKVGYFSTNLMLKWQKNVDAYPENASLDNITFFNGQIMIISASENKSESRISYYLSFVDSTGNFQNQNNPITSFQPVTDDYDKCRIIISSNKESFAILTRELKRDDTQKIYATVIQSDLVATPVKSGVIPFSERTFDFTGFAIGNSDDLVLLGLNSEKIKGLSSKRKSDYFLYSSPVDSINFTEFNITNDKNITGIGIEFDNINRQAVMAGFYSEKESYVGAGIYYASLNMATNKDIVIKNHRIEEQSNLKLKGERNSGSGIDLISYPIDRIILRNDGGAVIVAEAAYVTEYSYYDSFSQSFARRLEYNFDNILVISVSNEGLADWSTIIEKRQSTLDDGGVFSSFCSLLNGGQLVFIYNDQITRRNNVTPISVNNLGKITRLKPYNLKDGILLIPKNGKQVSENEIVIPAIIKRKLYFVKMTF